MNNNILESIEWHRDQLGKLLPEDDFGKVESEIDDVIEKFRLPGSKDKKKRKSKKGIKDIISGAFSDKKDTPSGGRMLTDEEMKEKKSSGGSTSSGYDTKVRNARRADKLRASRMRMV